MGSPSLREREAAAEFRMPAAAGEDMDASYETILLISVVDPDGTAIDSGLFTVLSSPLEGGAFPKRASIDVPIASATTPESTCWTSRVASP